MRQGEWKCVLCGAENEKFHRLNDMSAFLKPLSKFPQWIGVGIFSAIAVFVLGATDLIPWIDRASIDDLFRLGSHPERADTSVVIATIDQNSLNHFEGEGVHWPWPREFYSALVEYLSRGGVKAVVFDMDLSQNEFDRLNVDARESDSLFAYSIKNSGRVVLTSTLISGDSAGGRNVVGRLNLLDNYSRTTLDISDFGSAVLPVDQFMESCKELGVANYVVDKDGVTRRIPLLFRYRGRVLPQLALAGFMVGENLSGSRIDRFLKTVPTDGEGDYVINWYGKGGPDGTFKYYSISALVVSAAQMKEGKTPEIPPGTFKNKYVIVGGSAIGLMDFKSTPFTTYQAYPGMEIHATILSNFLQNDFMVETPAWFSIFLVLFFAFAVTRLFFRIGKIIPATLITAAIAAVYVAVVFGSFRYVNYLLPTGAPFLSILLAFSLSGAVSFVTEGRRRRELRRVLNRYLSPRVVDEVPINPDEFELGGREMDSTVFFSDIKNFTGLSEKLSPRESCSKFERIFHDSLRYRTATRRDVGQIHRRRGDGRLRCAASF